MAKKDFWKFIKSEAGRTLYIDGVISEESWFEDEVSPKLFREQLNASSGDIEVYINSPGGDVSAGVSIYNMLREYSGNVTVKVDGIAASIASAVAMAGDKIVMLPGSMMMIHEPWTIVKGNSDDLIETAKALEKFRDSIIPIYATRSGLSEDEVAGIMKAETWLTAEEAVAQGFADEAEGAKSSVSEAVKAAATYMNQVQAAVMAPAMSIVSKKAIKDQLEEEEAEAEPTPEEPTITPTEEPETDEEAEQAEEVEEQEEKEEPEMATQTTPTVENKEATKAQIIVAIRSLAEKGVFAKKAEKTTRESIIEAVKAEIAVNDEEGNTYVIPDAVISEIMPVRRDTDILATFAQVPATRWSVANEIPSEADLSRAGRWSKAQQKAIQELETRVQVLETEYLYKMQEISFEDMEGEYGDVLVNFMEQELPQKLDEEEERAFIVGDGRANGAGRKITKVVSIEQAAEDASNVHVTKYDGSGDETSTQALFNAVTKLYPEGTYYAVMNKKEHARLRSAGFDTASGLPFSSEIIAGAMGVERIFERNYVPDGVAYIYTGEYIKRLNAGNQTTRIEQYDIDYNAKKVERIRKIGGAAAGIDSAVKVILPTAPAAPVAG